jgi:hypothetical protein
MQARRTSTSAFSRRLTGPAWLQRGDDVVGAAREPLLRFIAAFDRRERRLRRTEIAILVLAIAVLVVFGVAMSGWLGALVLFLTSAAPSAGYIAAYVHLYREGLVHTPHDPWSAHVVDGVLQLRAGALTAALPLTRILRARYILDATFDALQGVDDVLELQLDDGALLRVPSSTEGFYTLRAALPRLQMVELGD